MSVQAASPSWTQRLCSRVLFRASRWSDRVEHAAARRYLRSLGVHESNGVFSYTQPAELAALMRLAMCCPEGATVVEIGSHLGASALFLGGGLAKRGGRLYCIDTWTNDAMGDEGRCDTFEQFTRNTAALSHLITPLRGWSTRIDLSGVQGPIQLLFIDGDHSYDAVRADFHYFEPLLGAEAVVAFHDTNSHEGVARFTGELLSGGQWAIGGQVQSLLWVSRVAWRDGRRVNNGKKP